MRVLAIVFPVLLFLSEPFAIARSLPFAQEKPVKVPGTKVSLVPPAGLKPTERFPGFGDEETRSSIMVTEMPAPYQKISEALTKEGLATKGINLLSKKEISLNGRPGILLHVAQEAQSIAFLKWMVITGDEKETVIVTATFPSELKERSSSAMEQSMLSVQWDAEAEVDPLVGLNFTFKDDPEMKFARSISNAAMLTKDGSLSEKTRNDPFLIIAPAISDVVISNIRQFAESRLMQIKKITDPVIKKQSDITIAGLPGSEIIAEARWSDSPDKPPVVIYQALLIDGNSYFLMQGTTPPEAREKYLAIFSRIAQSFRKK